MRHVVVLGAGVGGLAAAIELARRGFAVSVLESQDRPGGKAGREIAHGVEFDTGPSLLTLPRVFEEIFSAAGSSFADHIELIAPSPAFRYVYADGLVLDIHIDLAETFESVDKTLGREAREDLEAFMAHSARIWAAAAPNFVFGPAPSLTSMLALGPRAFGALRDIDAFSTMWGAIERRVRSPHLRYLLARYATYNGSDVHQAPGTLNCIAHVELALGGFGVRGGMFRLVEAMVELGRSLGVELLLETPVSRIEVEAGRVSGVLLGDGRRLAADAVVSNGDVGALEMLLAPQPVPASSRGGRVASMSATNLVLAAARPAAERAAHTVVFPDFYEREFEDIFIHERPPRCPAIYLCAQDQAHARLGWPDGRMPLFVMLNAPAEPAQSGQTHQYERFADDALARTNALGLTRDSDSRVWFREPRMLAETYPGSRGALYGAASNGKLAAFQRPANRVPGLPGLYLAGGSAHPGGGLPLCAASGRLAARAIEEDSA